jgi:hypothetical protein
VTFTPSSFLFMLLFITICCTDFYLFVLCSSLLMYSLSHFVPALYSYIGSWCIPSLHVVLLPCSSTGLRLSSSFCCVLVYLFINQILHFFHFSSSHFAHVSVLLCLTLTPVRISSITERLSLSLSCTDYHVPFFPKHLHHSYWLKSHC